MLNIIHQCDAILYVVQVFIPLYICDLDIYYLADNQQIGTSLNEWVDPHAIGAVHMAMWPPFHAIYRDTAKKVPGGTPKDTATEPLRFHYGE